MRSSNLYCCKTAQARAEKFNPVFVVDNSLGYPIIVVDENGVPVKVNKRLTQKSSCRLEEDFTLSGDFDLKVSPGLHALGIFTNQLIPPSSIFAEYTGMIVCFEKYSDKTSIIDDNFLVLILKGTQGIAINGNFDSNKLKYLNHSCDPNSELIDYFHQGCWKVFIRSKRQILQGEEVTVNYELHTEDKSISDIPCLCGSSNCAKYLYKYHDW